MSTPAYAIGQAVYVRTDTPDFAEESIPFRNLEEMVELCTKSQPNMVLDKLIVYAMPAGEPIAVTLSFVAATKGQRPATLETAEDH